MPGNEPPDEPTVERVREALSSVTDPDLGADVVASGLVEDVAVEDGDVTVAASFAGLDAERADELRDRIRAAVLGTPAVSGADVVDVDGPDAGRHGPGGHGGDGHRDQPHGGPGPDPVSLPDVDRVVAVASAKGGVGKTTVASQLARALAADGDGVGLFDADVYGPNVPELLDVDDVLEATDDGRARPVDAAGLQVLSVGLVANDAPLAWRGAMAQEAVVELLDDAAWDDLDVLVLDLPPGTGDVPLTVLDAVPVDGALIVTTPFPTAAQDAARAAQLFREDGVQVVGAVRNMAAFECPTCGDTHEPFAGDETPDLSTDVLAALPLDEAMRDLEAPVPAEFRTLADRVRGALADADFEVPEHALSLSGVPRRAARDQLLAEYDALDPGGRLHAVVDRDPGPLVGALDAAAGARVDVRALGDGEHALRVTKRPREDCTPSDDAADAAGGER